VADVGFSPKERSTTVAAQALGVARRAATRKARGTKGKRQKEGSVGAIEPATNGVAAEAPKAAASTTPATGS
jgi:hypothetical protein